MLEMQNSKNAIKPNHNVYELINGDFTIEEALDVLNNLISSKIDFHKKKNFSNEIRFGSNDEHSIRRIDELVKCRKAILEYLYADKDFKKNKIYSTISIQKI